MAPLNLFRAWRADVPASIVVFLVALPLCLGIAVASDAPPMAGIVAGVIGGIVVGAISGARIGVSGPAAGLAAIVATAITDLGSYPLFVTAVVLSGVIQVVFGLMRAGVVAYFFPSAVIKGMLGGIGIFIFLKQLPHLFGYDKDFIGDEAFQQPDRHNTISELWYMLESIIPGVLLIAAVSLGLLLLWDRPFIKNIKWLASIPGSLVAVIAGILLGLLFGNVPGLGMAHEHFVEVPAITGWGSLQTIPFPDLSGLLDQRVWVVALTIAVVGSIETLLSVEAIDKLDPEKRITPTDRELWAQGIGNIASGLVGGLPITQVIVRSSANVQAGGRTKLSTILHGVLLLVLVLLLPMVLNAVPLASTSAILLLVGYKLAKPSLFKSMWQAGHAQFIPFLVTLLGVVFINLLVGVGVGMCVALFVILRNNFLTPFHFDPSKHIAGEPIRIELSEDVTFLNKASVLRTLSIIPHGAHVIIDANRTVGIDPDVEEIIEDERVRAVPRGITIEYNGFKEREKPMLGALRTTILDAARHYVGKGLRDNRKNRPLSGWSGVRSASAQQRAIHDQGTAPPRLVGAEAIFATPEQPTEMLDHNADLHKILLARNKEWSEQMHRENPELFTELAKHQNPFFLWIGCSDSRVPPNQITGTMPGDMFIHRNIANMVVHTDMNMMSVLDYGVNVLNIDHVIVCGHYGCGGVKAAMGPEFGGPASGWVRHIRDVARWHNEELNAIGDESARFDRLVEVNVAEQVYDLSRTSVLRDAWEKGRPVQVHGWVYSLKDGLIKDLGVTRTKYENEEGAVEMG